MCNFADKHTLPMPSTKQIKILKAFNTNEKIKQIWKINRMAMDDLSFQLTKGGDPKNDE